MESRVRNEFVSLGGEELRCFNENVICNLNYTLIKWKVFLVEDFCHLDNFHNTVLGIERSRHTRNIDYIRVGSLERKYTVSIFFQMEYLFVNEQFFIPIRMFSQILKLS